MALSVSHPTYYPANNLQKLVMDMATLLRIGTHSQLFKQFIASVMRGSTLKNN